MANGVPVISSNAGGITEVNINNKTGFVSKIGDVKDMTTNALTLLKDENLHQVFKKQARVQAELFNLENIVNQYESVYVDAVASIKY